jgi:hypothetical protein
MLGFGVSVAGPLDAGLANENDNPAAPNTGMALFRRFRFGICLRIGGASIMLRRVFRRLMCNRGSK